MIPHFYNSSSIARYFTPLHNRDFRFERGCVRVGRRVSTRLVISWGLSMGLVIGGFSRRVVSGLSRRPVINFVWDSAGDLLFVWDSGDWWTRLETGGQDR